MYIMYVLMYRCCTYQLVCSRYTYILRSRWCMTLFMYRWCMINIWMYMYTSMLMYVCLYWCMSACIDVCIVLIMYCIDELMHWWWMYVWTDVIYRCMYVQIYTSMHWCIDDRCTHRYIHLYLYVSMMCVYVHMYV